MRELQERLQAARSFRELTEIAPDVLTPALGADRAVFTLIDSSGPVPEARWFPVNFPDQWFGEYEAIAPHDFVRDATLARPGVVMTDEQMVSRRTFEANPMVHRARDLGLDLRHALAVALPVDAEWLGGIAVFRGKTKAFGARERALLNDVLPVLREALRTCALLERAGEKANLLEHLFNMTGEGVVAFSEGGRELFRTAAAVKLLDRWFPHQRRPGLPARIDDMLRKTLERGESGSRVFQDEADDLVVSVFRPGSPGPGLPPATVITLRERPRFPAPPECWRERLSPREFEVASYLLRGLTTDLIAQELLCRPGTVSKHVQRIFDKLGVDSRSALFVLAVRG